MKNKMIFLLALIILPMLLYAQEQLVYETFKDRRVINSHSVEMLAKNKLDIRIGHRFGDAFGEFGGWPTFYGLENASDILSGFDYGVTNHINFGLFRTKGSGELRQNINSFLKFRVMHQKKGGNPISLTILGMGTVSTMQKSEAEGSLSSFPNPAHRLSYHAQLMMARKFSTRFALQMSGGWTYRNLVYDNDQNDLFHLGGAARIQVTRVLGLILDGTYPISMLRTPDNNYYPAIGVGFEIETGGGHVFQVNLTNASGMSETDYIPYTQSNWAEGEFRIGFTISRVFNM